MVKNMILNKEQLHKLEGLAYWIADLHYIIERYGNNEPELQVCRQTINDIFNELDALKVPFSAQNIIICWAEDWRAYKSGYTANTLIKRGFTII